MELTHVKRYAVYYGPGRQSDLAAFDLVILQPAHYRPADIAGLHAQGALPVAYLSLGEEAAAPTPAPWALLDPQTGRIAHNPRWQTTLIDCRSALWREHLLRERIPLLVAQGFAGLFLDTLDVQEAFPQTRPGVVALIRHIHATFPHLLLIANRGFSLLADVTDCLGAVLFEAFTTYHATGNYAVWDESSLTWTAQQAAYARAVCGARPLLALDYAAPHDNALRALAEQRALAQGLLPYVTTWALDWLPAQAGQRGGGAIPISQSPPG
jgi:polysaccharide biosynthesis protein PelA